MKITINPNFPTSPTLSWDHVKTHPGIYRPNYSSPSRFISGGKGIESVMFVSGDDFAMASESAWHASRFVLTNDVISFS